MDAEVVALAGTASTTVVALMATDAWQHTRDGLVALWQRFHPDGAKKVQLELASTRAALEESRSDGGSAAADLADQWRRTLLDLLTTDPAAASELRRLLNAWDAREAKAPTKVSVKASGHARAYGAGGNQYIIER